MLKNGDVVTESMTIINIALSNLDNTDVDMEDSDGDTIPNYIENLIHTDKDQIDTDHDGLTDDQEVYCFRYDPLSSDTDGDGIMDKDEDEDGDGITNKDENDLGSDPLSYDSDQDGLDDALELEYGTSLILTDTDNDGISDYEEYTLEKIGASHNEDGSYTATFSADMSELPYDKAVIPTVTLTGDAEGVAGFSMEMVENNPLFDPTMVGYMGHAYEFKTDGSMSGAELTFTYDESLIDADMLSSSDFHPAIYYYDPEDGSLTEVEDQTWTGNRVSVHLNHFSVYILANKTDLEAFWNRPFDTGLYGITDQDGSKKETGKLVLNVTDGDGNPVPNADVLVYRQSIYSRYGNWIMIFDGMDSSDFLMKGITDKDGKFKCELESKTNDCSGSYTILVDKDGAYGAKARIGAFYGEQFHDGLTEGEVKNVNVTLGKYSGSENANVSFYAYDGKIDGNTAVLYSYNLRLYKGWEITYFDMPVIDTKSPEEAWYKEVFGVEVPCGRYTVEIEKEGFPTKHMKILVTGDLDTPYLVGLGADDNIFETGKTTCDNNQDGLDDELTKLICRGDITTITGTRVFKGRDDQTWEDVYNEIMLGDDKDGDRLINGKEISICYLFRGAPYLVMRSDPELPDTDFDGIGDKEDEFPLDYFRWNAALDCAKTAISDPNAKYVGVIYLNKEYGAMQQGHAAILLVKDDGTGDFFSYASHKDVMNGLRGPGYLARAVDNTSSKPYPVTSIEVKSFLQIGKIYTDTVGVIHQLSNPNDKYGIDGVYTPKDTPYNRGFYIPVTDEEGKAMFDRALEIRKKPGMYDLWYNNCGHVAQNILEAGGKKFSADSNEMADVAIVLLLHRQPLAEGVLLGDVFFTRPNTTFELASVKKFPGSYKGTLEEINSFLYE